MSSLIDSVRQYLASQHMRVDDEWLSGCIEYLTEDSSSNYNENDVKNLAKEQWLLNDLKDICPGSLPNNLKDQLKTVLNGRFVLQINAVEDIGTPAYQQYLKLQKVNMDNVEATMKFEEKIPSHRMVKLYLTDGIQELTAIEYKPMRNVSCDITPGCKVLVKGPIECRRGILLLTESSIELLGGEVQEILVSNSLAGLLSSKLGLPLTQDADMNITTSEPRNSNIPTPHAQIPPTADVDSEIFEPTIDQTSRPVAVVTSLQVAHIDDDVDDDIDIDQIAAIEAQLSDNPGKRPLNDKNSKPEKKLKPNLVCVIKPEDCPDHNDLLFEDEEYLREIEARIDATDNQLKENRFKAPIAVSSKPFVYIKQINDLSVGERAGRVFRVKGQIIKLLSKLSVGKEGWSLRCTIIDGTGSLDVDFTSDVLSKLVGFTPQEMNQIKKEMATKPELKEKAFAALQKAKDSLQVLYCIIELTILEVPKITRITPFQAEHVDLLCKRLRNS